MEILVADDDRATRGILGEMLKKLGHTPVFASDGEQAAEKIRNTNVRIAILDWIMPKLDGLSVCKLARSEDIERYVYIIFVTVRDNKVDLLRAFEAGADDYITKPYDEAELTARVRGAVRVIQLQEKLKEKISELEKALEEINTLQGLIPICSYCKRVRSDKDYWEQVESYISRHSPFRFTHGICPDCLKKLEAQLDK